LPFNYFFILEIALYLSISPFNHRKIHPVAIGIYLSSSDGSKEWGYSSAFD
jgi:hypothetical protein